jgi:hypothetical protein
MHVERRKSKLDVPIIHYIQKKKGTVYHAKAQSCRASRLSLELYPSGNEAQP